MAISGRFVADFESFYGAVQKAEVSLKSFESGAGKVGTALDKMGNSFSGVKMIQEATLLTKVIEDLGGVTTLTGKEQAKVNATITEAIAKYKALGQTAPPAMVALAESTSKVSTFMGDLGDQVKATALGFISAQAVIGAAQAGFRMLTVFVGDSVESFANAEAAQKKLVTALEASGHATPTVISQFNALATEFQRTTVYSDDLINEMEALLTQVGQVAPDQMQKALQASADLASGLGIDLKAATLLVAKAFSGGGDELGRLKAVLGDTLPVGASMAQVLETIEKKFGGQAQAEIGTYSGQVKQLANEWDNFKEAVGKSIVQDPVIRAALKALTDHIKGTGEAADKSTKTISEWFLSFTSPEGASAIRQMNEMKHLQEDLAKGAKDLQEAALRSQKQGPLGPVLPKVNADETVAGLNAIRAGLDKADEAAKQHAASIQKLSDAYRGTDAIRAAKDTIEAVNAAIRQGTTIAQMSVEQQKAINKVVDEGIEVFRRHGQVAPQAMRDLYMATIQLPPVVQGLTKDFDKLGEQIKVTTPTVTKDWAGAIPVIEGLGTAWGRVGEQIKPVIPTTEKVKINIDDLARALAQLAQVSGGAFGNIIRDLSTVVVAMDTAQKATKLYRDGLTALGQGETLKGILGLSSGILGIASAAISAGKAIGSFLTNILGFGTAGRDAVKDFAASFGGFDALHVRLLALGDAGEALWVKFTQGVGRNNPAEAKAAIDAINKALSGQDDYLKRLPGLIEKYGLSWEDAGIKAKQAHLDEIAAGIIQDFADLSKAGFDVTLITEKMGTAIEDYYKLAKKTGTEIPIAMKPLLQKMIDLGELTDEAGNKIENLDDVHWAMTLTDGFKGVIDAIHELTEALTKGVGGALDDLSKRRVVIPIGWKVEPQPKGGDDVPGFASGGMITRGGLALVGERGPEIVRLPRGSQVFASGSTAGAQALAGAGATSITVNVDARGATRDDAEYLANKVAEAIMLKQRRGQRFNTAA